MFPRARDRRGTGRAIEQSLGSKLGLFRDTLDAVESRGDLGLVGLHCDRVVDAGVGGMNRELADISQQGVDFCQRTFCRLDKVGGILAVGDSLVKPVYLSTQVF